MYPYVGCRSEETFFNTVPVKQLIALLDECLQLLIVILGERYVKGLSEVTPDLIIQREIIHLLAITRRTHSDLDKNLPEDVCSEWKIFLHVVLE